jgi:hypothetical protein
METHVVPPAKKRKTNLSQLYVSETDGDHSQGVYVGLDEPGHVNRVTPTAEIGPECALQVDENNNATHSRESTESPLFPILTPSVPIGGCSVSEPKTFEVVLQNMRLAFHAKNSATRPSCHRWIRVPGDPNPNTPPVRENKLRPGAQVDNVFLGYNGPHVSPTWRLRDVYGQIKKIVIVDDIPNLVATAYCDPGYRDFPGMVSKLAADYSGIRRVDISWCMAGVSRMKPIESFPQPDAGELRTSLSFTCGYQDEATAEDHEEPQNVEELEDFDGLPSDSEILERSRVAQVSTVFCSGPLGSSLDQGALRQMHTRTSLQSRVDAPSTFSGSPSRSLGNELRHGSRDLDETLRKTQDAVPLSEGAFPNVGTSQPDLMNSTMQALAGSDDHDRNALQSCPDSRNGLAKAKPMVCDEVVGSRTTCALSSHIMITQNKTTNSSDPQEQSLGPMLHNTLSEKGSTQIVSSGNAYCAVESLHPTKWLSSGIINIYLRLFHQPPYHIVDSHYFDAKDPCRMQRKTLPRLPSSLQDGCKILAPVLHGDKHWTLLVLDLWSNTYDHFDSLGKAEYLDDVKQVVKEFLAGVKDRIREACENNFPSDIEDRPNMWEGTVRPLVSLFS